MKLKSHINKNYKFIFIKFSFTIVINKIQKEMARL